MGFIYGENRNQMHLYPATLEELVDENNPVRVIDAFVDHLNMDELEILRATPANTEDLPTILETSLNFTYTVTLTASVPAGD